MIKPTPRVKTQAELTMNLVEALRYLAADKVMTILARHWATPRKLAEINHYLEKQ